MEQETARRRISRIHDHVSPGAADHVPSPQLFLMNCSGTLNTAIPRYDNRLLFARQGSASQGRFMQQSASGSSGTFSQRKSFPGRSCSGDNKASSSLFQDERQPMFSRQVESTPTPKVMNPDAACCPNDAPKYSRQGSSGTSSEDKQVTCTKIKETSFCNGVEWAPPVDVAETGNKYVLTAELPGVTASDIVVELNDQSLTVMGKRLTHLRRLPSGSSESSNQTYHRREILQGPYRVSWRLPGNVNKNKVSAELVDGFLQIILPKV